jgi:SH3-like domain-containing protein
MRRHSSIATVLLVTLVALPIARAARAESFPYKARIAVPSAPIRSGPGDEFYATETLPEGETVEVYRHRHNGWCAIRPTEGSFSWIFGPHVRLLDDSLAEIDKPDVASRIGSRLGRQRNAVQVRLKKGEVVQVLEETEEAGQKWYKIAPPAGEFRWIHTSCLSRADGEDRIETPPSTENIETGRPSTVDRPIVTVATAETAAPAPTDDWRAAPIAPPLAKATASNPFAPTTNTSPTPSSSPPPSAPPQTEVAAASATAPPTAAPLTTPAATPTSTPPSTPQPGITVADGLSRQLTDVELRLSRMVSEPPANWQVAPLQQQAEQLLSQAQTTAERDAVKATLAKVDCFAAIQRRHQQMASTTPATQTASATPQQGQPPITPIPETAAGQYDAVGILRPVVSKRPGAPQFALVDPRGQVVSFVSPTPDVNLQPYVGHRIGIVGNRGFIPEFKRAHVTAGRVTPLEQNIVR